MIAARTGVSTCADRRDQLVGFGSRQLARRRASESSRSHSARCAATKASTSTAGRLASVDDLVTGEAVPLEMRLAKVPSRALAITLDWALLALVGIPLAIAAESAFGADPALQATVVLVGFIALFVGVPVLVETLSRGRSLGKLVLGLRVVRDDGGPARFRHALTRGLAGVFVDFLLTFGAGAVICSLLNERGKRVGDVLAGTVVVRERAPAGSLPLPAIPRNWPAGQRDWSCPDYPPTWRWPLAAISRATRSLRLPCGTGWAHSWRRRLRPS